MERRDRAETAAGILTFVIVGVFCGVILLIGEVPDLFKRTYKITVEFKDASGLVKGSDVDLSGALIGKVISDPQPIVETQEVAVKLKISEAVRIRRNALFTIESSGIFGDKFLKVSPRSLELSAERTPYIQNGDLLQGTQSPDLSALMTAAIPLIHTATHAASELDDMVTRLNTDVLTPDTVETLRATQGKLSDVGDNSERLAANINDLISDAKSENSVVGKLLYDKQVRTNLVEFIANYKAHGAVFYSDDSAPEQPSFRSRPLWRARR